jgi:UDP-N-acetylglucosamine 2-epimerase (non-hydrolysing)
MKILHVVGARPNFMKVAPVMAAIANRNGQRQILVHTGQHSDFLMSDVFLQQLRIAKPDHNLEVSGGTHAYQTAEIMKRFESVALSERPDLILVYGDVNSTMAAAVVCSKLLIPMAHVEAGLRSFDRTMPEEINRMVTDRLADLLFTPSADGNENLLREGVDACRIHLVGNVMIDTLIRLLPLAESIEYAEKLTVRDAAFILVTLHRPSNVDEPEQLKEILLSLDEIAGFADIIFPVHPRTRKVIRMLEGLRLSPSLHLIDPVGYLEFLSLQRKAKLVITDSGGIQEETTFLGIPCLTVRENTERPITVEIGSNILVGRDMAMMKSEAGKVLSGNGKRSSIPPLWDGKASERIADIVLKRQMVSDSGITADR